MSSLNHIAFIPDGNRRWARSQGLPAFEGHKKGYERFKQVTEWCLEQGIQEISFWGFSTENWKRAPEEVDFLLSLLLHVLTKDVMEFARQGLRLRVIGDRDRLSPVLQRAIENAEEQTRENAKGTVHVCFNYGGQPEILAGVKRCLEEGLRPEDLTEEEFSSRLWSAGMRPIDLIIRTSGEQRLSGFMPWLSAYSELAFEEACWPDFSKKDFERVLDSFHSRERRFGGDAPEKEVGHSV